MTTHRKNSGASNVRRLPEADNVHEALLCAEAAMDEECLRVEVPVRDVAPFAWLKDQTKGNRRYWRDRPERDASTVELAGVGLALSTFDSEVARNHLSRLGPRAQLHLLGRFEGGVLYTLPRVEVGVDANGGFLALNAHSVCETVRLQQRQEGPREEEWIQRVNDALDAIQSGRLSKVVLARHQTIQTKRDALEILDTLRRHEPSAYAFAAEFGETTFLGASPERLFRRESDKLRSDALAGTRRRGKSATEDAELARELLGCEKERREQKAVSDAVQARFLELCSETHCDAAPKVRQQAFVQHLHSLVSGRLRDEIGDAKILETLHPTPAVAGTPREAAREWILREEGERGHYAAPIGRMSMNETECAVALRCGTHRPGTFQLHIGAGIVQGSKPAFEWRELERKSDALMRSLDVQSASEHAPLQARAS